MSDLTMPTSDATLREHAHRIRQRVVRMCAGPEGGHLGAGLSEVELLTVLYFAVLELREDDLRDPDRDVFLLSKGHGALGLYATLAERGLLEESWIDSYGQPDSRLGTHPTGAVPGVEAATGSLGHGLALGAGFALAQRRAGRGARTFVLLGDGELQEGSVWEAAMVAATHQLDNLVAVVDRNHLQQSGATEEFSALHDPQVAWESFGWATRVVDGHDLRQIRQSLGAVPFRDGRPSAVIAETVKGRGVGFLEASQKAHFVCLSERTLPRALRALEQGASA